MIDDEPSFICHCVIYNFGRQVFLQHFEKKSSEKLFIFVMQKCCSNFY